METVKVTHAGATIELPAETVVTNWLATLQPKNTIRINGSAGSFNAQAFIDELNSLIQKDGYSAVNSSAPAKPPRIGEHWQGQGGIYAGVIRGGKGQPDRHLIVATDDSAEFSSIEWGNYGKELADCKNNLHGEPNTVAMAAAGSVLALNILDTRIDGHQDFYLPARHELRLCYLNVPELFSTDNWYWSSTHYSARLAFYQVFGVGTQGHGAKRGKLRARAVRSIQVSN